MVQVLDPSENRARSAKPSLTMADGIFRCIRDARAHLEKPQETFMSAADSPLAIDRCVPQLSPIFGDSRISIYTECIF